MELTPQQLCDVEFSEQWRGCGRRSEEHTSELQLHDNLVCRLLLEKKKARSQTTARAGGVPQPTPARRAAPAPCPTARPAAHRHPPRSRIGLTAPTPFFFNDTATTEIYTLSLHDALPI